MNVIKVNYNNAAFKKAKVIVPYAFCYRYSRIIDGNVEYIFCVEVDARLIEEEFYKNFEFELYINGDFVYYVNKTVERNEAGRYVLEFINPDYINSDNITVQIKGRYSDQYYTEKHFVKEIKIINCNFFADEELFCDEHIRCSDVIYGYHRENPDSFFTDRIEIDGHYEYDGMIPPASRLTYEMFRPVVRIMNEFLHNVFYVDIPTGLIYVYQDVGHYRLLYE